MAFNGERLKKARLYRNMTITELAEKINISKQAVSQFEKGTSNKGPISPKPDVFFAIVLALGFPKKFFEEYDEYDINIENTFFRALASTKNLDKKTQEIKTELIVRLYNFLNEYLDFPVLELPDISDIDSEDMNIISSYVRDYWDLGESPIPNMVKLLESKGIIVSSFDVNNKKIDAFTQIHKIKNIEQICVVLGNDKPSLVRRNFDCAHELGHILLHNSLGDLSLLENEEQRELELQANQFAGAFLLPRESFFKDLIHPTDLDFYVQLKKKWKVSIAAMIVRARGLGRITNSEYQALMKKISRKGWRVNEPFDNEWQLQRPALFRKSLELLINNNVLTNRQFIDRLSASGLSLNSCEVEELLSLSKGYLADSKTSIKEVEPKLKSIHHINY
ncbi:ImmA/IrrE family metallo-endopeptidase [Alkaliphilus pronyensis]|uniref:ImmA/IrrE family metallo-endopeptidase n=1 Tax=Alkaliphilus pronyensis TaxID=1482732 RepID=A0A6I0EY77_9FIRM|nr:XRE family transcriptional regulator [Alkaliphilus pronyensis]KAB3529599.1 ImmA/IrrE family metallo-endopeptidase [Alkaliphilus pronyensis]